MDRKRCFSPDTLPISLTPSERQRSRQKMHERIGGDRDARRVHLTFYQQHVGIRIKQRHNRAYPARTPHEPNDSKLSFTILSGAWSESESIAWQDHDSGKLDTRITEIAVEPILTAELQHREGAVRHYQWRVERKAQLEEEEPQRHLEAAR